MTTATRSRKRTILREITANTPGSRIDRQGGVIRGVKILGVESKNGRRYTETALQSARQMYEGIHVNIDHPSRDNPSAERSVHDQFGWLSAVRLADGGLYGDLHFLRSHPAAEQVLERAERNPRLIGLSHNAEGQLEQRDNGDFVVEQIDCVHSVDLVCNPATSEGLFESIKGNNMKRQRILNRIRKGRKQKRLSEGHGGDLVGAGQDIGIEITQHLDEVRNLVGSHLDDFLGINADETAKRVAAVEAILDKASTDIMAAISGDEEDDLVTGQPVTESADFSRDPQKFADALRGPDMTAFDRRPARKRARSRSLTESGAKTYSDFSRDPQKFANALR